MADDKLLVEIARLKQIVSDMRDALRLANEELDQALQKAPAT